LTGTAILALLPWGCAVKAPIRKNPPSALKIPPTCEHPLGGLYRHAKDPQFQYQAVDDGQRLELSLLTPPSTTEAPRIVLNRTAEGFRGETEAVALNGEQKPCPLRYPTEVTACDAEGLTLRTIRTLSIDERCQALGGQPPQWAEQQLIREPDAH